MVGRPMILTGHFRYQRRADVADRLNDGWRYVADLGVPHGLWSVLMWFCDASCKEDGSEVPR